MTSNTKLQLLDSLEYKVFSFGRGGGESILEIWSYTHFLVGAGDVMLKSLKTSLQGLRPCRELSFLNFVLDH